MSIGTDYRETENFFYIIDKSQSIEINGYWKYILTTAKLQQVGIPGFATGCIMTPVIFFPGEQSHYFGAFHDTILDFKSSVNVYENALWRDIHVK